MTRRSFLPALSPVLLSRADAQVTPELFRFQPELEPLVALIERTPRDKCAGMAVEQLRRGVSFRQFMAALFLAGIRNVNPRPPGFALHCVFIIHAAHLLSLEASPDARLLPLFFALDDFKKAQERDAKATVGDYTMQKLSGPLPSAEKAPGALARAMEAWDMDGAERAVSALVRHASVPAIFEMLWTYGARDYRNIGHKAIFTANAFRTLQTIGEQHAEPVLRSLVLALLDFGTERKVNGYAFQDQCYLGNSKRLHESFRNFPPHWADTASDPSVVRELLKAMRQGPPDEVCAEVARRLQTGSVTAGSVWDAVHLASAELRMRAAKNQAITGIHALTSANGLRRAYLSSLYPTNRLLILLQAVGWMVQFRTQIDAAEGARALDIATLEPAEQAQPLAALENPDEAARQTLRLAQDPSARRLFQQELVRLAIAKADEVHYFKYQAALIEDVPLVSAAWQPRLLAAAVFYTKAPGDADSAPVQRARELLRSL